MKRDFSALSGQFDLLVIGGGVYGAWIAQDAALRGLSVALVEQTDWGCGTSQSSSKLIHGGLRYLEHLKIGPVRRSLEERRRLTRLAPHRVYPLRFVVPLFRGDRVGKLRMEAGLWFYDKLAGADQPVARHTVMNRRETLERYGFLKPEGLKYGFTYGDCGTDDARFTLEVVAGAMAAGAVCVNHAQVVSLLDEDNRVAGAQVSDGLHGHDDIAVRARVTINAAGPWAAWLPGMNDEAAELCRLVKGVHLVLPALPTDDALLLTAKRDGRVFFAIPWYGRTLLGTTDTDYSGDPSRVAVDADDVEYLLTEANQSLGVGWTEADIVGRYAGVRTLRSANASAPQDATREWSLETPAPGLLMPVGGKFTSARAEAALTVARACDELGRPAGRCPTKRQPFAWAYPGIFEDGCRQAMTAGVAQGLDEQNACRVALRFGTRSSELHKLLAESPELARRLVDDLPFCRGEVVFAARNEMAFSLDDILRRRIPLALLTHLTESLVTDAAELAGAELGWSEARRQQEATDLLNRYNTNR